MVNKMCRGQMSCGVTVLQKSTALAVILFSAISFHYSCFNLS